MKWFIVLLFLALKSHAYGDIGRAVSSLGGVTPYGGGRLSGAGSAGVSPSGTGYENFAERWPGTGYYDGFGDGESFNSENSGATAFSSNAGGFREEVGSGVRSGSYGGSSMVGSPGGTWGGFASVPNGIGAGDIGGGVGSTSYGGTDGDSSPVGSMGSPLGGTVSVGGGLSSGSRVGDTSTTLGAAGSGLGPRHTDSLDQRRRRARVAGAVLGGVLGGLAVGSLIARLAKLRREGRLGSGGMSSSSYGSYDMDYGYDSSYRRRLLYRGYRRRCTNCRNRQRPCFGVQCN